MSFPPFPTPVHSFRPYQSLSAQKLRPPFVPFQDAARKQHDDCGRYLTPAGHRHQQLQLSADDSSSPSYSPLSICSTASISSLPSLVDSQSLELQQEDVGMMEDAMLSSRQASLYYTQQIGSGPSSSMLMHQQQQPAASFSMQPRHQQPQPLPSQLQPDPYAAQYPSSASSSSYAYTAMPPSPLTAPPGWKDGLNAQPTLQPRRSQAMDGGDL
jgi:hypothetical protein